MAFPSVFTKLGDKLATPNWLSATGNQIYYGRPFHNDAHRSDFPDLPASSWSVLYSSDHASGDGYIGRVDFDDPEGEWTDAGGAIHVGPNQTETPFAVPDPVAGHIKVYTHWGTSSGLYGSQAMTLHTTTDLASLNDQQEIYNDGQHCGYPQIIRNSATDWHGYCFFNGGEGTNYQKITSSDGVNWTRERLINRGSMHVAGLGKFLGGSPFYTTIDGTFYGVGMLRTRPQLDNPSDTIVCWEADPTTLRPTSGYWVLQTAGDGEEFRNDVWLGDIDGTLYLLYTVRESSSGDQVLRLARASSTAASYIAPLVSINADGSIPGPTGEIPLLSWDAANDPLPDEVTITVNSGTNESSQSAGNYYELKTGSSGSQDLYIALTGTVDPALYARFEWTIEGLQLQADESLSSTIIGILESIIPQIGDGVSIFWRGNTPDRFFGEVLQFADGDRTDTGGYIWPIEDISTNVAEKCRTVGIDLTIRVDGFGSRLFVLVDDQVTYYRDVSSIVTWGDCRPFLRIFTISPHQQIWARFTGLSVSYYKTIGAGRFSAGEVYHPGIQKVQVGLGV